LANYESCSNAAGKASSIQFLHFNFSAAQAAAFKKGQSEVVLAIDHEKYGHMAILPPATLEALASDFDDDRIP